MILWHHTGKKLYIKKEAGRQPGLVVRAGDLNMENPGSNPQLGLLNGFVLSDTRDQIRHAL